MGLLNESDWTASWISAPRVHDWKRFIAERRARWQDQGIGEPRQTDPAPYLRKDFEVDREVAEARVYVTGLGYYELFLRILSEEGILRRDGDDCSIVVLNFTPVVRQNYRIGVPTPGRYREVFNSDSQFYAGSNVGNGLSVATQAGPWMGRACALALAAEGASVVVSDVCREFEPEIRLHGLGTREGLDQAVAEVEARGGKAHAVECDVTVKADVERMVDAGDLPPLHPVYPIPYARPALTGVQGHSCGPTLERACPVISGLGALSEQDGPSSASYA